MSINKDKKLSLTILILTFNEELHIKRCIENVLPLGCDILVVDSYSSDDTVNIAKKFGVRVMLNSWKNYATQFNWGLLNLCSDSKWVLRLDADELLSFELMNSISKFVIQDPVKFDGAFLNRFIYFQGKKIKYGGLFPSKTLRLFRNGKGFCEDRWMDEHIKLNGNTTFLKGDLCDVNLHNITWWIEKHNSYASREAVDLLNIKYRFMFHDSVAKLDLVDEVALKRFIKDKLYVKMPINIRAFIYFSYRYILRLGFLDGAIGFHYHFLQGFWYRLLVDAKVQEVIRVHNNSNYNIPQAIQFVLGIDVTNKK